MKFQHKMILLIFIAIILKTDGKKQSLRQTIYSHTDTVVAPILAYSDDRSCHHLCGYEYPGAPDTPHCCGTGDTAGTYSDKVDGWPYKIDDQINPSKSKLDHNL